MEGEKFGTWKDWGIHVLQELKRLNLEQHAINERLVDLLAFKVETQTSTKVTAVLISSLFGLVSICVSVYVSIKGLH